MTKDYIYRADGSRQETSPKNGTDYTLEELQAIVDGYIELVHSADGEQLMVVDEEGKLKAKPRNDAATLWYIHNGGMDMIAGDVLICAADRIK